MTGRTINATGNNTQVVGTEASDTLNSGTFSNVTLFSYQAGNSFTAINLGSGSNNTVVAHTFDTITAGTGTDSIQEYQGHNNLFNLGDGNFNVSITTNDTVNAGNGNDTINFYSGATNDVITLGNGTDVVNASGMVSPTLTINTGTGATTINAYSITGSGSLTLTQAQGAAPEIIDLDNSTMSSAKITVSNAADVLITFGSHISSMTLNVAVDGYKAPYEATSVTYVATQQAVATGYNTAQALPYFISNMLFNPVDRWTSTIGKQATAPTVHFSFMQSLPSYADSQDAFGFATLGGNLPVGLTPQQVLTANTNHTITLNSAQLAAITALANWAAVVNVNFVSSLDSDSVEIRFGENSQGNASGGYSYTPEVPVSPYYSDATLYESGGDIYINKDDVSSGYFNTGGYGGLIFAHELGHTLGQGGESGTSDSHDTLPFGEDTIANTIESYNTGSNPYPNGPQPFDVATSQYLYGPNPSYHPNASHIWSFSASGGTGNLISDGGTGNTISASGATLNAYIDLRPGHWSYLGTKSSDVLAANQLFIDYGTVIDHVIGGKGADTIICNDTGDVVTCGNGGDTVVVAGGNDTIAGGTGTDLVLFADVRADYSIMRQSGQFIVKETVTPSRGTIQGTNTMTAVEKIGFSDVTLALDYNDAVQELYVAYFGRAADSSGWSNFEAALAAAGAPKDIQGLNLAYGTNASVKNLVDAFGTSAESAALYTGTTTDFVNAIYTHVLNRSADSSGLQFWVGAIDQGILTKGNAALSIMAGALVNTSSQGLVDAAVVNNKIDVASNFTFAIDTPAEILGYAGNTAAATVRNMLSTVTNTTDTNAFESTVTATLASLSASHAPPPPQDTVSLIGVPPQA